MSTLSKGDRWATVSAREWPGPGEHRHVVRKGHPTSACGITALPVSTWRGNTTKPQCPKCLADEAERRPCSLTGPDCQA